jgi:hypothetical protein
LGLIPTLIQFSFSKDFWSNHNQIIRFILWKSNMACWRIPMEFDAFPSKKPPFLLEVND